MEGRPGGGGGGEGDGGGGEEGDGWKKRDCKRFHLLIHKFVNRLTD